MGFRYAIIGAGMQGTAAAYDLALRGDADEVRLLDIDIRRARTASDRVNKLAGREVAKAGIVNATDKTSAAQVLEGMHACMSCVPYFLNVSLAKAAIEAGVHFNDLGGNTQIAQETLALHSQAVQAGVSVLPDCGVAPGLANILAVYGMGKLDTPEHVFVRCGGLPQNRRLPLGYKRLFSLEGLVNEYSGSALVLREGKVERVPTFDELESIELPEPLGTMEAFTTSGGSSTCPTTFAGKLKTYDHKSIRYPGHHQALKIFKDTGFFDQEPVDVHGTHVKPSDVFQAVMQKLWTHPSEPDLVVLRVDVIGKKNGRSVRHRSLILDYQDTKTGFSAVERATAFSAAIITSLQARGRTPKGAVPLEKAIDAEEFVRELGRRDIPHETSLTEL
jgi:lysine 6-dehydrogenase